jgi:membrane protease subunit HflK
MYLEAMQEVFSNTSKVYLDSRAGGNLLYLPLDRLMQQAGGDAARASQTPPIPPPAADPPAARTDGLRSRERDSR